MGYRVVSADELPYVERPGHDGGPARSFADLTEPAGLSESRARIWRYPPRTRGRRHAELEQEEVFVVLAGTLTVLVGDPWERVDVGRHDVVAIEPGTALQLRNEGDDELVVFAYGAPPVTGRVEYLDDIAEPLTL